MKSWKKTVNHRPAASKIRHFFNKQRAKARGRKPGADRRPCRVGEGEDRSLYSHISIPPFLAHCKDFLLNFPQIPHGEKSAAPGRERREIQEKKGKAPAIHPAAGMYSMGRKMAGSILPALIFSRPRDSMLMAMAMISAPPTALISVTTVWGR